MPDDSNGFGPSRRAVLKSAGATATGIAFAGGATADDGPLHDHDEGGPSEEYYGKGVTCGYANVQAGVGFRFPTHHDLCSGEHPETKALKNACEYSLRHLYGDVPTLIAKGFIPYFDILSVGGFSHWLKPSHIRGDHMMDPGRPETVLVNNNNYCSQGIMFIPNHEVANREPPVYVEGDPDKEKHQFIYPKRENDPDITKENQITTGGAAYYNSEEQNYYEDYERVVPSQEQVNAWDVEGGDEGGTVCAPWHRHTDGAARFAWWYHRQLNQGQAIENQEVLLWCTVPAMFHVWPGADPGSLHVYDHGAPSSDGWREEALCEDSYTHGPYRPEGGGELTLEDLPEHVQEKAMPADLERELRILSDYEEETLYQMTLGEIEQLVR